MVVELIDVHGLNPEILAEAMAELIPFVGQVELVPRLVNVLLNPMQLFVAREVRELVHEPWVVLALTLNVGQGSLHNCISMDLL